MMLGWMALALAGQRAELDRVVSEGASVAAACSSARDAWTEFGRFMAAVERNAGVPSRMLELMSARAAESLFDADSRLLVGMDDASGLLRIGLTTARSPEDVARAWAVADPDPQADVRLAPDGWRVSNGTSELGVRREGDWVWVESAEPRRTATPPATRLADAIAEDDGCLLFVRIPGDAPLDVEVHLPLREGIATRFAVAGPRLDVLAGVHPSPTLPREVRSAVRPEGVAILGLGLDGIDFSSFLEGRDLRQARAMQRQLPIAPGTQVALLRSAPALVLAAMVPFPPQMGAPAIARRAQRVLRRTRGRVERDDATHFSVTVDDARIFCATVRGRLYLSNEPLSLVSIENEEGTPWFSGAADELAQRYPLVVTVSALPFMADGRRLDPPFSLALSIEPTMLRGEMHLPLSLTELAELLRRLPAPQTGPPRGEVESTQ